MVSFLRTRVWARDKSLGTPGDAEGKGSNEIWIPRARSISLRVKLNISESRRRPRRSKARAPTSQTSKWIGVFWVCCVRLSLDVRWDEGLRYLILNE